MVERDREIHTTHSRLPQPALRRSLLARSSAQFAVFKLLMHHGFTKKVLMENPHVCPGGSLGVDFPGLLPGVGSANMDCSVMWVKQSTD